MISGIYSAVFALNNRAIGSGIVLFSRGTVHGGDATYYYKGKYQLSGNNIVANVEVANHSGLPNAVFGPLKSFQLPLTGTVNNQQILLTGQLAIPPASGLSIMLKKVDEMIDV